MELFYGHLRPFGLPTLIDFHSVWSWTSYQLGRKLSITYRVCSTVDFNVEFRKFSGGIAYWTFGLDFFPLFLVFSSDFVNFSYTCAVIFEHKSKITRHITARHPRMSSYSWHSGAALIIFELPHTKATVGDICVYVPICFTVGVWRGVSECL